MKVSVNKWGNSKGIRLPKTVTETLNIQIYDNLDLEIKNGQIILSKPNNEITVEELFKDYDVESFHADIQKFEPTGNERW